MHAVALPRQPDGTASRTAFSGRTTTGHRAVGASSSRPCQSIGKPKKSGRTEGLDRRIDFFEVASRAFLAIVHAENELRRLAG
jgi:hypothetical protein